MREAKSLTWEQAVEWLLASPNGRELAYYCYYDGTPEDAAKRFVQSEEWSEVLSLLGKVLPGRVLDVGAGRGISSFGFATSGSSVVALEPDPSHLVGSGAIRSLPEKLQIEIVETPGESLPFSHEAFDVVYCRAALHHARNLERLVKESSRVLKRGGYFLATREHVVSSLQDLPRFLNSHPLHHLYGGESAYLLSTYRRVIRSAGLKLVRTFGPFDSPINYYPMTTQELRCRAFSCFRQHFGTRFGTWLAKLPGVFFLYKAIESWRCNEPGRLFTFLAVKP